MRHFVNFLVFVSLAAGLFWFWGKSNNVYVAPREPILSVPEASSSLAALAPTSTAAKAPADIENQKPLPNPPGIIKAVYVTSWSAASPKKLAYLIDLIKGTDLNAMVIDIKAYDGYVAYDIKNSDVKKYGAKRIAIPRINSLIKKLHDEGIYVIARITVFQDPILAEVRPDLAIHSRFKLGLPPISPTSSTSPLLSISSSPSATRASSLAMRAGSSSSSFSPSSSTLWLDHKKLAWIDPAARDAWDYNIAIARDAAERGFDELNFDYIRFASDGDLKDMLFSFYDPETAYKRTVIKEFFSYLRSELEGVRISADLFGLSTVNKDDLGIGQRIEDAYDNFDYAAPMIYPSHYARNFLGFRNPAASPYEVVKYSMEHAIQRLIANRETLNAVSSTASSTVDDFRPATDAKLRPWIQDFDLGAEYDVAMVNKQIQAIYDAFCGVDSAALLRQTSTASTTTVAPTDAATSSSWQAEKPVLRACESLEDAESGYNGFMLWNPSNVYSYE